eukprot:TRINITY_DN84842_c0_g1_i1.p1 TRINITY_DN84842_c0_g1~~TRINITY_DN84842_c0_g1_i1.p1  ORF type:complete len:268 (+),score=96.30 TRINITY_DN84842_c0_g1_i1:73-876(+)
MAATEGAPGEARERSRSPRGNAAADTSTPATASEGISDSKPAVPSHWLAPAKDSAADGASAATASSSSSKGKGKSKNKAAAKADAADAAAAPTEEAVTAVTMLAKAQTAEAAGDAELGSFLRRAAAKLGVMEKTCAELGQTLQTVYGLVGRTLEGMGAAAGPAAIAAPAEGSKSYLFQKGDEDLAEAHRQAAAQRPSMGVAQSGGSLSTGSKTRDEMDAARRARLERLETQQATRHKELEDAATKARAKEALFNTPFAGAARPLGQK